jgi:hypothetical protein
MRFGQSTPSLKACCISAAINARRFDIGQTVPVSRHLRQINAARLRIDGSVEPFK